MKSAAAETFALISISERPRPFKAVRQGSSLSPLTLN